MKRIVRRDNKDLVLSKLIGESVVIEAIVSTRSKDRYDKRVNTMCLMYCKVNGKAMDHIWLRSDTNAIVNHNGIQGNDKIKFKGIVYSYRRIDGTIGYSVKLDKRYKVSLVKATYEEYYA